MPDLRTDTLTYPEFKEATKDISGTYIIFDVKDARLFIASATECGDWQYGDWEVIKLITHISKEKNRKPELKETIGRLGGDTFCIFTPGDKIKLLSWENVLKGSPVKVHWGIGGSVIQAEENMLKRRHSNRVPRKGIKHGNGRTSI